MNTPKGKKVRDVLEWPPSVWATSGSTDLSLYSGKGKIEKALVDQECISLRAQQDGKLFISSLKCEDASLRGLIIDALNSAIGETVNAAGDAVL